MNSASLFRARIVRDQRRQTRQHLRPVRRFARDVRRDAPATELILREPRNDTTRDRSHVDVGRDLMRHVFDRVE